MDETFELSVQEAATVFLLFGCLDKEKLIRLSDSMGERFVFLTITKLTLDKRIRDWLVDKQKDRLDSEFQELVKRLGEDYG